MSSFRVLRHTYHTLILSIAVIVFCVIGYFGGVLPFYHKITALFEQKKMLLEEREMLTKKLQILDGLDEFQLRSDLETVLSAVPSDKSIPTLFRTVEGVANQSGVSVSSISISAFGAVATVSAQLGQTAVEKQIGTHITPFVVNILGNFENIQSFITLAPSVRRLMRIRTFALQFPKDETPLQVSLDMDVFYEPLPTSLGAMTVPISDLTIAEKQAILDIAQFPIVGADQGNLERGIPTTKANPFLP